MIFVMAASGEVGRATMRALLEQGVPASQIVGGARDPGKAAELARAGFEIRHADYVDGPGLEAAFQGVETLVLIPTKTLPPARCVEHANALEAAKAAGVKRAVFLSIQAATPQSRFAVAPFILFAECATRISGMQWTLARMSLYSDPLAEWLPELAKMGHLPYPVVNARIAYVARADVARGLAAVARNSGLHEEILELTGPAAPSMPELASIMSDVTGSPIGFRTITGDEYRALCRKDRLPEEMIEFLLTMYHAAEAQEFSKVTNDIERLTGVRPESVGETLARLAPDGRA